MVAHICNPSTQEAEAEDCQELEFSWGRGWVCVSPTSLGLKNKTRKQKKPNTHTHIQINPKEGLGDLA